MTWLDVNTVNDHSATTNINDTLGANRLTSERGVSGDFEKNILQVHLCKKKIPAQDYCPKRIHTRTVSWKKNSGKMFAGLTHSTLSADC